MIGPAARLAKLAAIIDDHTDWWRFPGDGLIKGFLGTDPLFIVGDQPSTSSWESSNPNRGAFYSLLVKLGIPNAHLTDLYKKRGPAGYLRKHALPPDFAAHLEFFRKELAVLRPTRIVALGDLAYRLLATHVPESVPVLASRSMWHFSYAVRYQRIERWESNAHIALRAPFYAVSKKSKPVSVNRQSIIRTNPESSGNRHSLRHRSQRAIMRDLFTEHHGDVERVIAAYADAERAGRANRSRNSSKRDPDEYARALLYDGLKKGWLKK